MLQGIRDHTQIAISHGDGRREHPIHRNSQRLSWEGPEKGKREEGGAERDEEEVDSKKLTFEEVLDALEILAIETPPDAKNSGRFGDPNYRVWRDKVHDALPSILETCIRSHSSQSGREVPETGKMINVIGLTVESSIESTTQSEETTEPSNTVNTIGSFSTASDIQRSDDQSPVQGQVRSQAQVQADALSEYISEAFGNYRRIDFGTGHELNFLCFVIALSDYGFLRLEAADVVVPLFQRYLRLARYIQNRYRMEPAGSRGAWGLDDFFFLPFLFGTFQLASQFASQIDHNLNLSSPTISPKDWIELLDTPADNSGKSDDEKSNDELEDNQDTNIKELESGWLWIFLRETKKLKGNLPLVHSSPLIFNIFVTQPSWQKISEGMSKMYKGEVLSKFPVMQHFIFAGSFAPFHPSQTLGTSDGFSASANMKDQIPTVAFRPSPIKRDAT